jgi:hypothetical protein
VQKTTANIKLVKYECNWGSRFNAVFVPLFRGHLVKYNYILIFYNIDTMSEFTDVNGEMKEALNTSETPIINGSETPAPTAAAADPTAAAADPTAAAAADPTAAAAADPTAAAPVDQEVATGAENAAKEDAPKADVAKTCVEPMDAAPAATDDGKYVMHLAGAYTVFTISDNATTPDVKLDTPGAKFFKVLPDETKGGKHKKQHKSAKKQHKSAKKQRKLAKKQHKSAKKQRKSRSSRRYKK